MSRQPVPEWFSSISEDQWRLAAQKSYNMKQMIIFLNLGVGYTGAYAWLKRNRPSLLNELRPLLGTNPNIIKCATGCGRDALGQRNPPEFPLCRPCVNQKSRSKPIGIRRITRSMCEIPQCGRAHYAHGFCGMHWSRLGSNRPMTPLPLKNVGGVWFKRICKIDNCKIEPVSSNMCEKHRSDLRNRERAARREQQCISSQEWKEILSWESVLLKEPCVYCGGVSSSIDHINPVSKNGSFRTDNLAPACISCNSSKHDKSLLSFLLFNLEKRGDETNESRISINSFR